MEKKIRVGVVGLGKIAHIAELPSLAEMPEVEIVAAFDVTQKSLDFAASKYSIETLCTSFEDFLKTDMDCAFVMTPKTTHYDYVIPLLRKGIDVFCEKPLAMTLKQSKEMVDVAEETGKILMLGLNRRYSPVYAKAKAAFAGKRPDVVIAQKNRNGSEYRATLENAIHMVDLLRWFLGEPVSVEAFSKYTDNEYEDLVTAHIKFDSGSVGILVASRGSGQWVERLEAYGGSKSVFVNAPDDITVVNPETEVKTVMTPLAVGWARVQDKMGFTAEIRHFIDCVKSRTKPITSADDAYRTHLLMNEILTKAGLPNLE